MLFRSALIERGHENLPSMIFRKIFIWKGAARVRIRARKLATSKRDAHRVHVATRVRERRVADGHLVDQNADRPEVDVVAVAFAERALFGRERGRGEVAVIKPSEPTTELGARARTSGDRYSGVPQTVCVWPRTTFANPKSTTRM